MAIINAQVLKTYFANLFKYKILRKTDFRPLFTTYYITMLCNFRCNYCEFSQKGWTTKKDPEELNTEQTIKLLKLIQKECGNIYFTGGEPLIRPDIIEILKACKEIGFSSISVNTNFSLYPHKKQVMDYVDYLAVSLDSMNAQKHAKNLGITEDMYSAVINNLIECAKLQKEKNFKLVVNCVATPDTIEDARDVMNFCFENNISFAFVPASVGEGSRFIDEKFINNNKYTAFIDELINNKKKSLPVFNSYSYLNKIKDFKDFKCLPTLVPHINPKGELFYPCEPFRKIAGNILQEGSYKATLKKGMQKHGPIPSCHKNCYKSCYIEPSQFIEKPGELMSEISNRLKNKISKKPRL